MSDTDNKVDYANLIKSQTRQVDIDQFKQRGMKKVNVINAKKINELISKAVTNILGRLDDAGVSSIKDEKAQVVMDSMSEFKRLFADQKKESEEQKKVQAELSGLREALAAQNTARADASGASNIQMQNVEDAIIELKAFIINQASKSQGEELTRTAMMEQQQDILEDHFNELKAVLATSGNSAAQSAVSDDNTKQALEDAVGKISTLIDEKEASKDGGPDDQAVIDALNGMKDELCAKLEGIDTNIKEVVGGKSAEAAAELKTEIGSLRDDLKTAGSESIKSELESLLEALKTAGTEGMKSEMTALREELAKSSNEGLKSELTSLRDELAKSSSEALKTELASLRDELKSSNTDALKSEITALRDDLAEKTVAAGTANTEALQAQMAAMQEMLEKGGGGGGGNIDLNDIVSKLEGSISKKFAAAGIGKEEVSADDSDAAASVMLGAAFKGMDDGVEFESNMESMSKAKKVDKKGGKKAKSALDALRKFKKG
ncbi:MAG: hypothetical protein L3J82_09250 [Planctomycetes bacterium]|nr:hypothetical protein [Planctomycetota bacterium]